VNIEGGMCSLCRDIFADEEGKKGFKIFEWHKDVFRMVKSSRMGCRVCRLLGQTVKEHGNGSMFEWMGGSSNWICVHLEDWEGEGNEKKRRCYVTRTIQDRPSLWKFDVVWIYHMEAGNASIDPLKKTNGKITGNIWNFQDKCPVL
jgi:hypothetical protein